MTGDRFVPLSSPHPIVDPHYIGFGETRLGELYAFSAPRGISRINGDRLVDVGPDLDLLGMAEFREQELWFSGRNGILRVPADRGRLSWEDRSDPFEYVKFGRADGLNSTQSSVGTPNIIIDRENRLWVPTVQGLAMIDLLRLPQQHRPPAVFVEEVSVDRRIQLLPNQTVLPPGNHRLELKFDAIELTSPERIRFQYRLDDVDGAWLDAGTTRTAVYTSVPIGRHLFRVRACNSDGIWDPEGIAYGIIQEPFFYETNTFRLIAVAVLIVLGAAAFRFRVRRIAAAMHARFDERLAERTRIARELHDTLLQNFHGLMFQFQAARNLMTRRPDEAMRSLDDAINETKKAITESRDAIQDLRSEPIAKGNLAELLMSTSRELADSNANDHPPVFDLIEEGERKILCSTASNEICRIALELMRNAYQHAHAQRVEAEIRYGDSMFRLRIRDDGKGIDPNVLKEGGRTGHWGLRGIRERADRIGAHLDLWSEPGNGTEVQLLVPASIGYESIRDSYRAKLVRKVKSRAQR